MPSICQRRRHAGRLSKLTREGRQHPPPFARVARCMPLTSRLAMVCRAIDELAVGAHAPFCGRLVGDEDTALGPAEILCDADMRSAIARFAKQFASFAPRAVYSIWVKWYLCEFNGEDFTLHSLLQLGVQW